MKRKSAMSTAIVASTAPMVKKSEVVMPTVVSPNVMPRMPKLGG